MAIKKFITDANLSSFSKLVKNAISTAQTAAENKAAAAQTAANNAQNTANAANTAATTVQNTLRAERAIDFSKIDSYFGEVNRPTVLNVLLNNYVIGTLTTYRDSMNHHVYQEFVTSYLATPADGSTANDNPFVTIAQDKDLAFSSNPAHKDGYIYKYVRIRKNGSGGTLNYPTTADTWSGWKIADWYIFDPAATGANALYKNPFFAVEDAIGKAQTTANDAKNAANTAQSTANSKLSSVKSINGVSLVGTGNLTLAQIGIDGNICEIVTALPNLAVAKTNKLYLVPVTNSGESNNTYAEYVKITVSGSDKWEKLGEWKASITVDSSLNASSTNPVQNKVVNSAVTSLTNSVNACVKTSDLVELSEADINTLWTNA